jgi:hypothetical protein
VPYGYFQVKLQFDNASPEDLPPITIVKVTANLLYIEDELITMTKTAVVTGKRQLTKATFVDLYIEVVSGTLATTIQTRLQHAINNGVLAQAFQDFGLPAPKVIGQTWTLSAAAAAASVELSAGVVTGILIGSVSGGLLIFGACWIVVKKLQKQSVSNIPVTMPVTIRNTDQQATLGNMKK